MRRNVVLSILSKDSVVFDPPTWRSGTQSIHVIFLARVDIRFSYQKSTVNI